MKTTEMFIEQLVIGIAVYFTGAALASPGLVAELAAADFGEVALVAAGAYLLGMFYDRFADTLLQDLEQQHRLMRALVERRRPGHAKADDAFPENVWRARLWFSTDAATEHATYFRSRIRLTRAVTTLLPAAGVAGVLYTTGASPWTRVAALVAVVGVYGAAFLAKLARRPSLDASTVRIEDGVRYALPKTRALENPLVRTWYERMIGGVDPVDGSPTRPMLSILLRADAVNAIAALALVVFGGVVALWSDRPVASLVVALATPAATLLAGWTWWRITETFFAFLSQHFTHAPMAK